MWNNSILYRLEYFVKLKYTESNIEEETMFNNNSFGDRLKELRKSKKLTQVQVSEMIDVQQGTYSRWENGTLEPNLEAVVKLAKLFDTTTDYLLGKTIYSTLDVVPHPITRIDLKKLKEFNKTELDDLKFAIVMNGIKSHSTLPKYLDELVSENNLDEEEQEILHTLFKEVYDYFNAD